MEDHENQRVCPRCNETPIISTNAGYCRECKRAYLRDYRVKNKERLDRQARERYYANHEAEKALRKRYTRQRKIDTINAYGGKCVCCGETELDFLAIDHIYGGGKQDRGGASAFYTRLKREGYPQDGRYRVLCHNCNQAAGYAGRCPHPGGVIQGSTERADP